MGDSSDYSNTLDNSKAVAITGKIMVIAIIVLFAVVVVVLFLHLYARWFWWRVMEEGLPERNPRRRRRRFVFVPGQDPAAVARRGLDPAVLRSIPVVVFKPEEFKEGLECAVCLCDVAEDEKARLLPKCNHGFHVECIDMWFQSHSTCPLCRNPVNSDCNSLNDVGEGESSSVESSSGMEEILENGSDTEAPHLPVNVLFWGDETRVSSRNGALEEANHDGPPSFSPGSSSAEDGIRRQQDGVLVIEIPRVMVENTFSPSTSGCPPDELKSPVTGRLRSFRRLLSRERRVNPCSPNGAAADIEQGGRNTTQPC